MLFALIVSTVMVCPDGPYAFHQQVAQAARELGVPQQLYVEIAPSETAPTGMLPTGPATSPALAWSYRRPKFDWTIHIRYDVLHASACGALRVMALHEVCHIKLKHYLNSSPTEHEAKRDEQAAEDCARSALTPEDFSKFTTEMIDGYLLTRREKIAPFNPDLYYFIPRKEAARARN